MPYHLTLFAFVSLSAAFFNPNMSISSSLFLLSTNFTLHIVLTIDLSALLKIATLFFLKHHVLLPYLILHSFYIPFLSSTKRIFFQSDLPTFTEFLPSHPCSCSYYDFTSSTGIQPITKITKSLYFHHTLPPVTLLLHHLSLNHI